MVGKRNNPQDRRLPKYVYLSKGRYVYRPRLNSRQLSKETVLCSDDASLREIWEAYEALTAAQPRGSLSWISEQYLASSEFGELAPRTQKDYRTYHRQLMQTKLADGRSFGDVSANKITPGTILTYRDRRAKTAAIRANREVAYLSIIFSWGRQRNYVKDNPARGIRKKKEKPRGRYVEDWEYEFVFDLADSPHYVRPAMELAYLMRLRKVEVLDLTKQDVRQDGIRARRRKGSREQMIGWSTRLANALRLADAPGNVASFYVIHNEHGQPIPISTFDTAWQRLMHKAVEKGLRERFTFHDLKAKGISDFEGDKQKAAGHRSAKVADAYNRKVETVDPTK